MEKKFLISLLLLFTLFGSIKVYAVETAEDLPSKYDLRNDISIKVERQLTGNYEKGPVCYDYTKIKMIETYIQKTKEINYNLSETYYAYHGEDNGTELVLESDFPNKLFSQIKNIDQRIEEVSTKAVVKSFEYLPKSDIIKNKDLIKKYIMNYGGILTTTETDKQWDNYKGGIYRSEKIERSDDSAYHSAVIIGWDDNYSKDNFVYVKPQNDGAWLILNTWGSNWGNNGTAWLSYEDVYYSINNLELIKSVTLSSGDVIETKLSKDEVKQEDVEGTKMTIAEDTKNNDTEGILTNSEFITTFIQIFIILLVLTGIICLVIKIKNKKKTD